MAKKYKPEDEKTIYNYLKILIGSYTIIEMMGERKGSSYFNGKAKNAALVLRKQATHDIEKDINGIYGRDSETANSLMESVEAIAKRTANLEILKLANMSTIFDKLDNENCILVDRDYYEELERIKVLHNKYKKLCQT